MTTLVPALFFIALIGAFLQTNIGFGFPVFAMIFLPALFPFSTAVALCQVIAMASTIYLTCTYFKHIDWKTLLPLLVVSLAFGILVTLVSIEMDQNSLQILLGVTLIAISIFTVRYSERITVRPTMASGAIMGLVAGTGNGLFGIGGPPVAIYLLSAQKSKESYLATIQCYFLLSNISTLIVRTGRGALEWSDMPLILAGWSGIAAGTFLGLQLFKRIPHQVLRKLVYGFVGVSGVVIIVQQLW
jgi:uncharacterized membrane protein YfcA